MKKRGIMISYSGIYTGNDEKEVFFLKLDGVKILLICLSVMFFTAM